MQGMRPTGVVALGPPESPTADGQPTRNRCVALLRMISVGKICIIEHKKQPSLSVRPFSNYSRQESCLSCSKCLH